jgi:hypothetical protein
VTKYLKPGWILGIVAVVLTVTGTAAASSLITSSNIKDGTIQARDIKKGTITRSRLASSVQAALAKATSPVSVQGSAPQPGQAGPAGLQGAKGDTGAQGLKGDTGAQGLKGEKGDAGSQGLKGDKGDAGSPGLKGDKGDAGSQGDKGEKGDTGAQGLKGDTGAMGPQGPAGPALPKDFSIQDNFTTSGNIVTMVPIELTSGGLKFGPYPDGGSASGSVRYDGLDGTQLKDLSALKYTITYQDDDDRAIGVPYLRIFLNGGADDIVYDPTECATASPHQNENLEFDVVTGTKLRYDDDACGADYHPQSWQDLVAEHGDATISSIKVSTGFTGGQNLTAFLHDLQVGGRSFSFGS